MKRHWIYALLLLVIAAGLAESRYGRREPVELQRKLDRLEQICSEHLPRSERREALRLIREIRDEFGTGALSGKPRISDAAFAAVLTEVQERPHLSHKKDIILRACASTSISSEQLRQLIAEIWSDRYRVDTVKEVYSSIYDPQNMILVTSVVQSRLLRRELEQWIAAQQ